MATTKSARPNVMMLFGWLDPDGFEALSQYALRENWHLDLRPYFTDSVPEKWRGNGIIYSQGGRERADHFIVQQAARCPVVVINSNLPDGLHAPFVAPDNIEAGRRAAVHLIERGHREFAYYSSATGTVSDERQHGFEEVVKQAGHTLHSIRIARKKTPVPWESQRMRLLAQIHKLPPRIGVLALDDLMALDLIEAASEAGRRVPQDLAVVGLGNTHVVCESAQVPITSIGLRPGEVALQAAELLKRMMAGAAAPTEPIRIAPGGLVARESTDITVVNDPRLKLAVGFIQKNLRRQLSLDDIASAGGISRRTLYNLMEEELDATPADYLRRERMLVASRLLAQNDEITLREVAQKVGFSCTRTLARLLAEKR